MFKPGQQVALVGDLSEIYVIKEVQNTPLREILVLISPDGEEIIDWATYYIAVGSSD